MMGCSVTLTEVVMHLQCLSGGSDPLHDFGLCMQSGSEVLTSKYSGPVGRLQSTIVSGCSGRFADHPVLC